MKTEIRQLERDFYDYDNMCNSCDNPLPLFDTIVIKICSNKYKSPLCISCLNKKGISYE
jgi:hypothetical protein